MKGLTCATFVLAVFESMGIRLVDEQDWPVRQAEDREYLKRIAPLAKADHLKLLTDEVDAGIKRLRPQELVGACAFPPPATFEQARGAGQQVIEKLRDT